VNPQLEKWLKIRTEFTAEERHAFDFQTPLFCNDFIKSGDSYFKPDGVEWRQLIIDSAKRDFDRVREKLLAQTTTAGDQARVLLQQYDEGKEADEDKEAQSKEAHTTRKQKLGAEAWLLRLKSAAARLGLEMDELEMDEQEPTWVSGRQWVSVGPNQPAEGRLLMNTKLKQKLEETWRSTQDNTKSDGTTETKLELEVDESGANFFSEFGIHVRIMLLLLNYQILHKFYGPEPAPTREGGFPVTIEVSSGHEIWGKVHWTSDGNYGQIRPGLLSRRC